MSGVKNNLAALAVLFVLLAVFPAAIFAYRAGKDFEPGVQVIEIAAKVPESGGFVPDRIQLAAGQTAKLRISSPDVIHGFSIPELGVQIDEVYPGKPVEVTIKPEAPGRYAFACTRWCGVDHWRMRGILEVVSAEDGGGSSAHARPDPAGSNPLYERLGIDLDAMRHEPGALPGKAPSVAGGAAVAATAGLPAMPRELDLRAVSPANVFERLRAEGENATLSDDQLWDLVAWGWLKDVQPGVLARAQALYARDCAACHGETGRGDGVAGRNLQGMSKMDPEMKKGPADFTDAGQMLSAPDALLQGKILRGGMGTGMPEFGSLYTDEELWAMVSYLRTFLFTK